MKIKDLNVSGKKRVRITCNVLIGKFFNGHHKYFVRAFLSPDTKGVEKIIEDIPDDVPEDFETGKVVGFSISENKLETHLEKVFDRKEEWVKCGQTETKFIKIAGNDFYIKKLEQ